MDITSNIVSACMIVEIVGDLDGKTSPVAQDYINSVQDPSLPLIIDMSNVAFMSSAGLRLMLSLYRSKGISKGTLALVGLSEEIQEMMEATGFLVHFTTCNTVADAIAALHA